MVVNVGLKIVRSKHLYSNYTDKLTLNINRCHSLNSLDVEI